MTSISLGVESFNHHNIDPTKGANFVSAIDKIAPISRQIWDAKYRLKDEHGKPIDSDIESSWLRVAKALAQAEKDPDKWVKPFYEALEGFKFLPAGRIMSGAGSDRKVTLFNCFVMGDIPDSLDEIFKHLREAALTMQQGGGIGYDFSSIRPNGAPVRGVGADASGPLSFMDVWDSMCKTVMSAGARRGAMMATMRCDHPDIEAFIAAKQEKGRLRNFNLSVLATDPFMKAVEYNLDWDLAFGGKVYRTVKARYLWDSITRATYDYAEPGVIFIDRINDANNLYYCETIHSTNPCGEQPLPAYGACLLGSINLASLVRSPFTKSAKIYESTLADLVGTAIRMMDNTIDVSGFPLDEQRQEAITKRRIGLGMTGLADALMMVGLRYGSPEAAAMAAHWMEIIANAAYTASAHLAAEKGAFPLYEASAFYGCETMRVLSNETVDLIHKHGIRNALLTSIAPTGTISIVADNISSGVEPVFAYEYTRKVTEPDGNKREEKVSDHAVRMYRKMFGDDAEFPEYFVTAQELTPTEHIIMQSAVQRYVDSAISKTVNVPEDIPFEEFQEVYMQAYRGGCKGCTTYRPNAVTGSVLTITEKEPDIAIAVPVAASDNNEAELFNRTEALNGNTYKLRWFDSEHAMYITINDIIVDGVKRPFEVFVNSKNLEYYSWVMALTRMISAVFRRGGDMAFVSEELKQVFDPRGGQWDKGKYVPSLVAAIGGIIERHIESYALTPVEVKPDVKAKPKAKSKAKALCPQCSQPSLIKSDGCMSCTDCGWSKCG